MVDTEKKHPADVFVDSIIDALNHNKAPYAVREMADKVYRPFLKTLDQFRADQIDARTVADGLEANIAMMVTNYVSHLTSHPEAFADICQEIVNNIALRINDDITGRFDKKEKPHALKIVKH